MNTFRVESVWRAGRVEHDQTIVVDHSGTIQSIRPGAASDGEALPGLLVPGLINAHLHLELSWMQGEVAATQQGLVEWVERQLHVRSHPPSAEQRLAEERAQAAEMVAFGTAAVFDISNGDQTAEVLADAGLSGIVQHELLTMDRQRLPTVLKAVNQTREVIQRPACEIRRRPGPHALYSTAPQLLRESAHAEPELPFSIHIGESVEEQEFIGDGQGPFVALMDALGVDWRWWDPVGMSLLAYLDALGLLGPRSLLVHGVLFDQAAYERIAERQASLCLCPRSNRWITGRLPRVELALTAGCRLCIGTDSVASNHDLDMFAEIAELGHSFPEIGMDVWLTAATESGADVLGLPQLGRIDAGCAPGLLLLSETDNVEALRAGPPSSRQWLVRPGIGDV